MCFCFIVDMGGSLRKGVEIRPTWENTCGAKNRLIICHVETLGGYYRQSNLTTQHNKKKHRAPLVLIVYNLLNHPVCSVVNDV